MDMMWAYNQHRAAPLFGRDGPPDLRCPGCGSTYTHHCEVDVFVREREDAPSARLRVTPCGSIESEPNAAGNSSSRRDSVSIWLTCENCDALSRLDIAQHKGATEVTLAVIGRISQPLVGGLPFAEDDRPTP